MVADKKAKMPDDFSFLNRRKKITYLAAQTYCKKQNVPLWGCMQIK